MEFSLNKPIEIIDNTPKVFQALLHNLSDEWCNTNEGDNTWNVKEVLAHLIVCEKTNWIPRIRIILNNPNEVFASLDMQIHYEMAKRNSLNSLLIEFSKLRDECITELKSYKLNKNELLSRGIHPVMGEVPMQQIIATWVAHDLSHLSQIARILAKQNTAFVGSFTPYFKILKT